MASTTKKIKNDRLGHRPYWENNTELDLQTKNTEYLDTTTGDDYIMAYEENEDQDGTEPESKETASGLDDFDFVDHYGDDILSTENDLLPEDTAHTAISCGFIGVGGGGGKMSKAFLDLGFNKTLLINTTEKDQPEGVPAANFLLLEGADGVGKDVNLGKRVLSENSTVVEDTLRNKFGKVDWLFVLIGGGGGTGSSAHVLHETFERYLKSVQAGGKVVYIVSIPTSQELLNPTIRANSEEVLDDIRMSPHIVIDNERQLQLLRGKVGMLGMYPRSNNAFAKMIAQIFKLANEVSPVQSFDSKDLERILSTDGRLFLGTTAIRDPSDPKLGIKIFQSSMQNSPCPAPQGKPSTGALLLIVTPEMADDPGISNHMESAISYVGGRSKTLFSGVYVRQGVPGLIAITAFGGLK